MNAHAAFGPSPKSSDDLKYLLSVGPWTVGCTLETRGRMGIWASTQLPGCPWSSFVHVLSELDMPMVRAPVAKMVLLCQLEKEHHFLSLWREAWHLFVSKLLAQLQIDTVFDSHSAHLVVVSWGAQFGQLYEANLQKWQASLGNQNQDPSLAAPLCCCPEHTVSLWACHWPVTSGLMGAWHTRTVTLLSIFSVVWSILCFQSSVNREFWHSLHGFSC